MQNHLVSNKHFARWHIGLVLAHRVAARAVGPTDIDHALCAMLAHINTASLANNRLAAILDDYLVDIATTQPDRHERLL